MDSDVVFLSFRLCIRYLHTYVFGAEIQVSTSWFLNSHCYSLRPVICMWSYS